MSSFLEELDPCVVMLVGAAGETCSFGMAILDARGVILFVNERWARLGSERGLLGDRPCVGMNYLDVCDRSAAGGDAGGAAAAAVLRGVIAGDRDQETLEYACHAPGEKRWYMARFWAFTVAGNRFLATLHVDVTDRVEADIATHRSMERYVELLNGLPDAVVGADRGGRIKFATQAAHGLLGYPAGALLGMSVEDLLPPALRQHHAGLRAAFDEEPSRRRMGLGRDLPALRRDGTQVMTEIEVTAVGSGDDALFLASLRDVDAKHRAAAALAESEQRYQRAAQASNEALWEYRFDEATVHLAPRFDELLGYPPATLPRDVAALQALIHPDDFEPFRAIIHNLEARAGDRVTEKLRLRHRDGSWRWFQTSAILVRDADCTVAQVTGSLSDITDRQFAEDQLLHLAFHDTLTGLPNRALFLDRLAQAVARSERDEALPCAVLLLDLDGFKNVNDLHGHPTGDCLLREVGRRLREAIRGTDTVARLGGDEFAVLLDPAGEEHLPTGIADRVMRSLRGPIQLGSIAVEVSTSIGIVMSGGATHTAEEFMRNADIALYRAKNAGRNMFQVFDPEMHERVRGRLTLEQDLRRALDHDELVLFLQPIVSLPSARITGFEALVRWRHPTLGLLGPTTFIPLAEETGLITSLGDWVLGEACRIIGRWRAGGAHPGPAHLSVNVSSRQFTALHGRHGAGEDFHQRAARILGEHGVEPGHLSLELTESVLMSQPTEAAVLMDRLSNAGFRLALDDFGTGYSSLSYLNELPFHTVKLDRSFIRKVERSDRTKHLLGGIVQLTRRLGLATTAEGIETAEQRALVEEAGADFAQGYLFSRPVPEDEAFQMWTRGHC